MNPDAIPAALLFAVAFAIGVRSTWHLWRTYRAIAPFLTPARRILGQAFVVVSATIVIAVGWLDLLAVRRLLGFESLEWSQFVSFAISTPVLFVPAYLEWVWNRLGRG